MLFLKPRSEWGARPPSGDYKPWALGGPVDLVVHWVGGQGTLNLSNASQVPQTIRNIQAHEMDRDYIDIAYNLICDPWGGVWEGRGLGVQGAANGPSTNSTKPSICLLLNQQDAMTTAMAEAIRQARLYHVRGALYSHSEVNATTCPGSLVAAWVIGERLQPVPPMPIPIPIPIPIPMEEYMMLMRGDKTPHVWIVNGPWKTHITAAAYPGWLWTCAQRPGALALNGKEHVVPQAMIDVIADTARAVN